MTGFRFYSVDLVRLDLPYQPARSNAACRHCLVNAQYLDLAGTSDAMAERLPFAIYVQGKCFKAFGRDKNFL